MERFFDESLNKRLPRDPFEEASPPCPSTPCPYALHLAAHSCSSKHSHSHLPPTASSSLVQRVTIQTSSSLNPSRWRICQVDLPKSRPSGSLLHSTMQQQEKSPDRSSSSSSNMPTSSGQPDVLVATTEHSRPRLPPLYVFIRYHFLFTNHFSFWCFVHFLCLQIKSDGFDPIHRATAVLFHFNI